MRRNGTSLDQKQEWMREKHSPTVSPSATPPATTFTEHHYTVAEIAYMWNLAPDTVRRMFEHETGVLVLGESNGKGKRRYTTLRIPESVAQRVYRRLLLVGK